MLKKKFQITGVIIQYTILDLVTKLATLQLNWFMVDPGSNVIVGFKEGNEVAFRTVFDKYHRALYHFVLGLTADANEAEDIVSETFIKLWNRRSNFETEANIKAFLYITARNASLNFLRYKKKQVADRKELFMELSFLNQEPDAFDPGTEVRIETHLLELILSTLESLPSKQREIMAMILFEGLNDEEVAIRLNRSTKTVQNLKSIAIGFLRGQLEEKKLALTVFLLYNSLL